VSRNHWVWVRATTKEIYAVLRGRFPAKLIAHFKIRDNRSEYSVCRLAGVQFASAVPSGRLSDVHGLVTVQIKKNTSVFIVVDIGTILALAHLIPEAEWRWIVNSRIDMRTFMQVDKEIRKS